MGFTSYEAAGIGEAGGPSMHIGFGKIKIELGKIKAKSTGKLHARLRRTIDQHPSAARLATIEDETDAAIPLILRGFPSA
jgi:hypothetical protein